MVINFYYLILVVIILIDISKETDLKVRMVLASDVYVNDSVTLHCFYDLHGEPLYSVKWYRGSSEFFRYEPQEKPAFKTFPLLINNTKLQFPIDISKSDAHNVTFSTVNKILAGNFSCEVSTDAPYFRTYIASAVLRIKSEDVWNIKNSSITHSKIASLSSTTSSPCNISLKVIFFVIIYNIYNTYS